MMVLPQAARCFAAVLQARIQPPAVVDIMHIATTWPSALGIRLLVALPVETAVASFMAIPSVHDAARVAQLLRIAGLDGATDDTIFKHLKALHAFNSARAFTLRRAMEWEAQDTAFWPHINDWPDDLAERTAKVAVLAEDTWTSLPMPSVHRLPRPEDYPDVWTDRPEPLPYRVLLESQHEQPADPLRAGIEWLHVWRLDAGSAEVIRTAFPAKHFDAWISALDVATQPHATEPLHRDIVLLEHLVEQHEGSLSLLEIDALLKGVSEPAQDENLFGYDADGREVIRKAVVGWLDKAGIAFR